MADRKTKARNGYQDAADMAIVGRYRGPASSSTMRPAGTDEVILASLEEFKEENNDALRKLCNTVRETRDKLLEGQRTIVVKEDKVLEALVRLKRPVHDDLEWERSNVAHQETMVVLEGELLVARERNKRFREIRDSIIAVGVGIVAVMVTFGWVCERLF